MAVQNFRNGNFRFGGNVEIEGQLTAKDQGGLDILTIDLADDDSNWTETLSGQLDKGDLTEGPLLNDGAMSLTSTAVASAQSVYIDYTSTAILDLSPYTKLGFWYKGGNDDDYGAGDMYFHIFQNGNTSLATVSEAHAMPVFIESADNVWKYFEITLDTTNPATSRSAVTRVSFYQTTGGVAGNVISVANIECFNESTGNGPVYDINGLNEGGVASGVTVVQGDHLQRDSNGRLNLTDDKSTSFAGVAIEGAVGVANGSVKVRFVESGIVNVTVTESYSAGQGLASDHATANTFDDGDASSEHLQCATLLVGNEALDVAPCLIGDRGFIGPVGS